MIRDVLEPTTKDEIDYVLMNMFKLDSDLNGAVSFRELVKYLDEFRVTSCSRDIVGR